MINYSTIPGAKDKFRELLKNGALLIDVRTPDEYKAGHVQGSQNIPLDKIANQVNNIKAQHKPVIAVCRSGARSGAAAEMLKNAGIEVYNGGGWETFERLIK